MILVCYATCDGTGWKLFADETAKNRWAFENPDKRPVYVFVSGPQYNIDTIEQAKFLADCKKHGFSPSDYRRFVCVDKNGSLELYGFENEKCLLRDVRNGRTTAMEPRLVKRR